MSSKKENAVRKPVKPAAVKAAVKAEPLMYVGPTIRGMAIQNRVYTQIPETAKTAMADCPLLANLFVPVLRYPDVEKQLSEGKGSFYVAYNAALSYRDKH